MTRSILAALVLASTTVFAAEWKLLETPDFSVKLPGEAKKKEVTQQASSGEVKITVWGVQTANAFFAVSTADYAAQGLESDELVKVRDGAIESMQATLEKDSVVSLDSPTTKKKYTGREFAAKTKTGIKFAARLFLVEKRLYQIICVSPHGSFSAADFKVFADSFKLRPAMALP